MILNSTFLRVGEIRLFLIEAAHRCRIGLRMPEA